MRMAESWTAWAVRTADSGGGRNTDGNEVFGDAVLRVHGSGGSSGVWQVLADGGFITDAAALVGTYRGKGRKWLRAAGEVRPGCGRDLQGRYLSFDEREEIALARARGESMRTISARLGRSPSTISGELSRNAEPGDYRAMSAHAFAYERAGRPKPAKLATNLVLRGKVEKDLKEKYPLGQIAGRLRRELPDQPEMWVATETY